MDLVYGWYAIVCSRIEGPKIDARDEGRMWYRLSWVIMMKEGDGVKYFGKMMWRFDYEYRNILEFCNSYTNI